MNKNLCDYQLIELLDVRSLLSSSYRINDIFDAIAKNLFNEYHIKKGDSTYDFLEIEFYYYDKEHPDTITYERNISKGQWFFHNSGMDISFESSYEEDFKKTSDTGNNFFGGILIRSLVKDGNTAIIGPKKCTWELFDTFSAFERKPNDLPIIEHKSGENLFEIYKTDRWLGAKNDKSKNDYEANLQLFRYYIKCPILKNNKPNLYKAQPWNTGAEEIPL